MSLLSLSRVTTAVLLLASVPLAHAQLRLLDNYSEVVQYGNDDDSTDAVSLGFSINFYGGAYTDLFINNNGNVTFAFPSGLGNPSAINGGLAQQGGPVLAPFFADVDTTYLGSLAYGTGTIGAFNAFTATWSDVAAFGSGTQPTLLNTFQLFLVDRSDTGLGNFDFEFNYTRLEWDSGANASIAALAGFSDASTNTFLLEGSGQPGAFVDNSGSGHALIANSLGVPFDGAVMNGRYAFNVRDGLATYGGGSGLPGDGGDGGMTPVPEPSTYGLLAAAFLAVLIQARRRQRS